MIGRHTGQNPLPSLTSDLRRLAFDPTAFRPLTSDLRPPTSGFTLVELALVFGIMIIVASFIAPAFTNLKSAGDVTYAAYTIKGVLEQARNYAMANNTYAWVGFFEEDASKAAGTAGNGRLVMSVVASSDGTNIYGLGTGNIDSTKLRQIGNVTKIDNVHFALFAVCA